MAQRSIPALSRTCNRKMPSKAALLKRTRAQRIPFRPGVRYSNQGRIHSRRPILSSSLFACKTAADHTFRLGGYPTATLNIGELYRSLGVATVFENAHTNPFDKAVSSSTRVSGGLK